MILGDSLATTPPPGSPRKIRARKRATTENQVPVMHHDLLNFEGDPISLSMRSNSDKKSWTDIRWFPSDLRSDNDILDENNHVHRATAIQDTGKVVKVTMTASFQIHCCMGLAVKILLENSLSHNLAFGGCGPCSVAYRTFWCLHRVQKYNSKYVILFQKYKLQ